MLNGINPDGLSGWSQISGWVVGTALVVLILAVGAGVVLAVWGRAWFSPSRRSTRAASSSPVTAGSCPRWSRPRSSGACRPS